MPSVRSAPLPTRVLLPSVAVAIVYALAGWAALLFVAPPLYAPAIFPAAGIGLVAVLVYGARVAPAIALASALVHLTAQLQPGAAGTPQPAVALAIACGAALQALAGAVLVRRSVGGPLTLDTPRAVARFFCFGALLACVVGATLGTLALWLGGGLPSVEFARTWATWWAGDALGVTVAAPIALCLVGEPREAWWPRLRSVALPLAVGLVLLGLATSQVSRWQEQRVLARFERDADGVSRSVDLRLRAHLDALDALHGVYVASHDVDRIEFRRAAEPWLRKLPSLKAMGWHERLPRSALPGFEAAVRAEGDASFRVFDRDPSLTPGDDELIAMRYVEPRAGNETAVGVNALSIPASRQAVEAARRGRAAVATAPFRLTQEPGDQMGVVVYRAVRGPDDGALRGLVFVTLRMEDTLAALRAGSPDYLQVCLIDTGAPAGTRRLAGPPACDAAPSERTMLRQVDMPFAGRAWELRVEPRSGVPAETGPLASERGTALLFSITGLAATGMMGALLLIVTGRARRTEVAVTERTLQLEHEMAERLLTERALRESEQRFRTIFNAVPLGVAYTEPKGRILQLNPAFSDLTGYSESELVGRSVLDLCHPEDRSQDAALFEQLADGMIAEFSRSKRLLHKDGGVTQVRSRVSVLYDEQRRPWRAVAVLENTAEHVRLEEAERARESAEASNRAKSNFLSRMSHELRTPLNAMLGFAQLLELDGERMEARHTQWIGQIRKAGWHLLEMINDVLDLSRIESGTVKLQLEPLRLEPLLAESMAMVEPQARERGVHLARVLTGDTTLRVFGDSTRIKQILTNLLSNAIKYNRDGGDVRLGTRRIDAPDGSGVVEVEVIDTGLGMNPDQLAQLFQPFNRLGRERGNAEGTGIGLVISKLLAERLGGALTVRSSESAGSTFTLALPLAADANGDSVAQGLEVADPGYHRRHVLYIEDNEINVEVMRGIFAQRRQVQLDIATTGLDGLAAVRTAPPDLILLDMHLPDIDGMTLLQHLQDDPRSADIPVIVVSADALPAQIAAAMSAGAIRYVTKPFSLEEMLAVLDEQLSQMTTRFG